MKYLILLALIACGKDPANTSKTSAPAKSAIILESETVSVECIIQNTCQKVCVDTYVACVAPCGGQNTTYKLLLQNPEWGKCQGTCMAESQACYKKIIQITKEEYGLILAN
jgi:hypothetical protein